MMIVLCLVLFVSWLSESWFADPDDLQYLFMIVVTVCALEVAILAGVLILGTIPWRRSHLLIERIVKSFVLAATVVGAVLWIAALVGHLRTERPALAR